MNSIRKRLEALKNRDLMAIRGGWKTYLIITFVEAVLGVFLVYPFVGLADGFSRWNLALEICDNGKIVSNTLLSPIIAYIQAFTWKLFNSYAIYTLIQAWLFYIAIGVNTKELLPEKWWWIIVAQVIVLFPTVYIFPLLFTDSAPTYIFIALLCPVLMHKHNTRRWVYIVVLVSLCVGIRVNSLVLMSFIVAVFVGFAIWRKKERKGHIITAIVVVAGMALGVLLPSKLLPSNHNASVLGMVWEMTGICAQYPSDDLKEEMSHYGDIDEAINRYGEPYLNSIVWDNNPPFPAFDISGSEKSKEIIKIYVEQAFHNTKHFLNIKRQFVSSALGISNQLISSRRGVHGVDERTMTYGALPTAKQNDIREQFYNTTDCIGIISLRPIVILFLSIFIALMMKVLKINCGAMFAYIFMAMGYYSSFLINTQAHEYRYFAPSFYILLIVSICGCIELITKMIGKTNCYSGGRPVRTDKGASPSRRKSCTKRE